MRVLDVGCGTGRTLIWLQKQFGCDITGVDVRPMMIRKAKRRAQLTGINGAWKIASAEQLPFASGSFDVVLTESVNVFVNAKRAVSEYRRVLQPDGIYVDVEMLITSPVTDEWKASVKEVYGAKWVPDQSGWKQLYLASGFREVRTLFTRPVTPEPMENLSDDDANLTDEHAFSNQAVISILQKNADWLSRNYRSLGYAAFLCRP